MQRKVIKLQFLCNTKFSFLSSCLQIIDAPSFSYFCTFCVHQSLLAIETFCLFFSLNQACIVRVYKMYTMSLFPIFWFAICFAILKIIFIFIQKIIIFNQYGDKYLLGNIETLPKQHLSSIAMFREHTRLLQHTHKLLTKAFFLFTYIFLYYCIIEIKPYVYSITHISL